MIYLKDLNKAERLECAICAWKKRQGCKKKLDWKNKKGSLTSPRGFEMKLRVLLR